MSEPQQGHVSWSPDYKHEKPAVIPSNAQVFSPIDAALAERDKRIAELERDYDESTQVLINTRLTSAEVAAELKRENRNLHERLASLQALMEQSLHACYTRRADKPEPNECWPNCPRCAYERWKEDGK